MKLRRALAHLALLVGLGFGVLSQGAPHVAAEPAWHHGVSTFYTWRQYGCGVYGAWRIPCSTRHPFSCGGWYRRETVAVAHLTLPCGTKVELRNPANGKTVIAVVRDRGPFTRSLDFDLTTAACLAIGHCYTGPLDWRIVR